MPLFRKRRTIWQIKEMEGYLNKVLESQVPPDYNVNAYNQAHQALDKVVRINWEHLHPAEQDFIYSWFIELRNAEEQKKDLQAKLEAVNNEMAKTQETVTSKIEELNKESNKLNTEMLNVKNVLSEKMDFLKELTNAIEGKTIGAEQLRKKVEERIKNMNDRMIKQQEKFEASQIKIGNQFKTKVMELDEEKLLLDETIEKNTKQISRLEKENQELKMRYHLLKRFQDKLTSIKAIIESIPANLFNEGGN